MLRKKGEFKKKKLISFLPDISNYLRTIPPNYFTIINFYPLINLINQWIFIMRAGKKSGYFSQ